jgi:hypothetical protein
VTKARLLPPSDSLWATFLEDVAHDFYHLPAYVAFEAAHLGGEPRAIYVETGSGRMLVPIVVRAIPGGGTDATTPYGYPGPLLTDAGSPPWYEEAWAAAKDLLRAEGLTSLFVRFHPILSPRPPTTVGTHVLQGETVSMDLGLSSEEALSRMRRDVRRTARLAEVEGIHAHQDATFEQLAAFVELYHATMARVGAYASYYFDQSYFEGLREALGPRLSLWLVDIDDAVAAAGLFVETRGLVQFHLSGSVPLHRMSPNRILIFGVRDWAAARGDRSLHLGGGRGGSSDSLFSFKAGFSPLRHPFYTLRIILEPTDYERLVADHDPNLDPARLDGYFPLYRT